MTSLRQGAFTTPEALARALLAGPLTPARIRRFRWHAAHGTDAAWARTLAALPEAVRAQVAPTSVPAGRG